MRGTVLTWGYAVLFLFGFGHAFQTVFFIGKDVGACRGFPDRSGVGVANFVGPLSGTPSFMTLDDQQQQRRGKSSLEDTLRDKLRKATGFSLTAFRAAWRTATGISLTAIYATALAASGLWIRKITSLVLSIFPAWFRYFLQPFLIAYYIPIFIIRGLTGPTRKQAKARHEAVKESLRDAIEFAQKTKGDGYWPVEVNDDGDFELVSPPRPKTNARENLADAVAESFEKAMEQGYHPPDSPSA